MLYNKFEKTVRWIVRELSIDDAGCQLYGCGYHTTLKKIIPEYLFHSELGKYVVELDREDCTKLKVNNLWKSLVPLLENDILNVDTATGYFTMGKTLFELVHYHKEGVGYQTCNCCKRKLPFTSYSVNRSTYCGITLGCKQCAKNKYIENSTLFKNLLIKDYNKFDSTELLESLCVNPDNVIREKEENNAVSVWTINRFKKAGLDPLKERLCQMCETVYPITMFSISKKPGYIHNVCKACWGINKDEAMAIQYKK